MNNMQAQYLIQKYGLEYRQAPLAEGYGLFVPETLQTGAQISADRISNEELRKIWFYTANASFATKRKGKLLLGIGGNAAFNAVFGENTGETCRELRQEGYAKLNPKKRDLVLWLENQGYVEFVEPTELDLRGNESEYREFPIRTDEKGWKKDVTVPRMPFVRQGFGSGYMLGRVMETLHDEGKIKETIVYTMNPENAAENVQDGEIIARACRLISFDFNSRFNAFSRGVGSASGSLRGVLLERVAEGDARKNAVNVELEVILRNSAIVGNVFVVEQGNVPKEVLDRIVKKQ